MRQPSTHDPSIDHSAYIMCLPRRAAPGPFRPAAVTRPDAERRTREQLRKKKTLMDNTILFFSRRTRPSRSQVRPASGSGCPCPVHAGKASLRRHPSSPPAPHTPGGNPARRESGTGSCAPRSPDRRRPRCAGSRAAASLRRHPRRQRRLRGGGGEEGRRSGAERREEGTPFHHLYAPLARLAPRTRQHMQKINNLLGSHYTSSSSHGSSISRYCCE